MNNENGRVEQSVARLAPFQEVAGSSPAPAKYGNLLKSLEERGLDMFDAENFIDVNSVSYGFDRNQTVGFRIENDS